MIIARLAWQFCTGSVARDDPARAGFMATAAVRFRSRPSARCCILRSGAIACWLAPACRSRPLIFDKASLPPIRLLHRNISADISISTNRKLPFEKLRWRSALSPRHWTCDEKKPSYCHRLHSFRYCQHWYVHLRGTQWQMNKPEKKSRKKLLLCI